MGGVVCCGIIILHHMRMKERNGVATSCSKLFTIDKTRWGTLCDQIADGFRNAIAAGVYKPGDMLPQMRELAAHFGVSIRVVARAFAKLADEQLVAGRSGIGCKVLSPRMSLWKGMVLLIVPGGDYVYHTNIFVGRVADKLSGAGYMVQRVTVPIVRRGVYDLRYLDLMLRQPNSLVMLASPQRVIERHLSRKGARYVVVGGAPARIRQSCVGRIALDMTGVFEGFAAHVVRKRLGRVAIVGTPDNCHAVDVMVALRKRDIKVDMISVNAPTLTNFRLDALQRAALQAFRRRLAHGRHWLPDVLFFVDEYRAMGGALALYEAGVRIPEDVGLVSITNVGNGPVLRTGVARMEFDPFEQGDEVSAMLIDFLATGRFPDDVSIRPRYLPAETFPA